MADPGPLNWEFIPGLEDPNHTTAIQDNFKGISDSLAEALDLLQALRDAFDNLSPDPSLRIVRGRVGSTGTVVTGLGWSVVRNATGDYTLTFSSAFGDTPSVSWSGGVTATVVARVESVSASAVRVRWQSRSDGSDADVTFGFVAVGQR